jgi:hypothetical protein
VIAPLPWLAQLAAANGLHYEADADERWIRAWEPFATLRTPVRYEHALHSTGGHGSVTMARMIVDGGGGEMGAWIVIAQDPRLAGDVRAAATCDTGRIFGEPLDLVPMARRPTGDAAFDHAFASFAPSAEALALGITPSLRKLLLGWRLPVHLEIRPGGFILAPVSLVGAGVVPTLEGEVRGLTWLLGAVQFFGDKAGKRVK